MSTKVFFIGAGKMASAIARGMRQAGWQETELAAFDPQKEAAGRFASITGSKVYADVSQVDLSDFPVVLLAVKPQMLAEALQAWRGKLSGKLVLSIVAGVPLAKLQMLSDARRIIRIMPNTPAMVGCGAAAYAGTEQVTMDERQLADKILASVGLALPVPERDLDAVTALSGSGPAYVLEFIQSLADGGVAAGLSRSAALLLSVQTVLGTAKMVQEMKLHPDELKDMVTSPAGTTVAGLRELYANNLHGAVIDAVMAAKDRSVELGKN